MPPLQQKPAVQKAPAARSLVSFDEDEYEEGSEVSEDEDEERTMIGEWEVS
jgi:hypothetical protein